MCLAVTKLGALVGGFTKGLRTLPGAGGRLARGVAGGAIAGAGEGATEYAQTLIEEAGKGNDPFSEASLRQAGNAAALGFVGGAGPGGVGGAMQGYKAQAVPGATAPAAAPMMPPPSNGDATAAAGARVLDGAQTVDEAIWGASTMADAPAGPPGEAATVAAGFDVFGDVRAARATAASEAAREAAARQAAGQAEATQRAEDRAGSHEAGLLIAGERIDQDNRLAALPAQQQAARQASAIESADARVEGQRIAASAAERTAMLDGILATPGIQDPIRAFEAQMKRQGYTMPIATVTERARAQRRGDITAALGEGNVMPLPPNGMDMAALVPERTATAVPETAMAAAMRAAKARAAAGRGTAAAAPQVSGAATALGTPAAPMQPAAPAQATGLAAELARMQARRARHALSARAGATAARSAGGERYNGKGDMPFGDAASSRAWAAGDGVAQPPLQYNEEAEREDETNREVTANEAAATEADEGGGGGGGDRNGGVDTSEHRPDNGDQEVSDDGGGGDDRKGGVGYSEPAPDNDGHEVSDGGGRAGGRRRAPAGRAQSPIPRTQAPEPAVIVQPVRRGTLHVGFERLDTPQKAAHAFAALRKAAREYYQIIVTDKDDKPLAAYTIAIGTIGRITVYPREVLTAVYMTPGAAKVWLAHNHPGGTPAPSKADITGTESLKAAGIGRDFGVTLSGHVIIAGHRAVSFDNADPTHTGEPFDIPKASRRFAIPILERAITRRNDTGGQPMYSLPEVINYIEYSLKPQEPGLILFDAQLRVMGWWPMTLSEMRKLRTGNADTGAGALLRMVGKFNPNSAVVYSPAGGTAFRYAANNLYTALALIGVSLQGAISRNKLGYDYKDEGADGWLKGNPGGTLFSRMAPMHRGVDHGNAPAGTTDARGAQARAQALQAAIQSHLGAEGKPATLPANAFTIVRMPFDAALQRIAGAFGKRVVTFRVNRGAEQLAGFFEGASRLGHGDPDTIYIRADVPRPHLSILGHELAHTLAADNPALYQQLVDALKPYIRQRAYARGFASQYEGMAESEVTEEFIGEVLADGFMNERFWQALGRQNPSLLNRVMGTLRSLMQRAADVIGYTPRTARYLRDFERVMALAGEAVAQYGSGDASRGGGVFSRQPARSGALKRATYRERLAAAGLRMQKIQRADPIASSVDRERGQTPQREQSRGPSGPFSFAASQERYNENSEQAQRESALESKNQRRRLHAGTTGKVAPDFTRSTALSISSVTTKARPRKRPTWQQSEFDVNVQLAGRNFQSQVSFKRGVEVPYGSKGSVRPDFYRLGGSVEVKNYNVQTETGRRRIIENVIRQIFFRIKNLPKGTKQEIRIDVRGQNIFAAQLSGLIDEIVARSNGSIHRRNIQIIR